MQRNPSTHPASSRQSNRSGSLHHSPRPCRISSHPKNFALIRSLFMRGYVPPFSVDSIEVGTSMLRAKNCLIDIDINIKAFYVVLRCWLLHWPFIFVRLRWRTNQRNRTFFRFLPTHCTSLIRAGRTSSWVVLCSADYLRAELGKSWPLFGIHRYGGGDVFRISSFMKCTFINTSPSRLNDTGPPPFGQQSQYMTGNGPKPDLGTHRTIE